MGRTKIEKIDGGWRKLAQYFLYKYLQKAPRRCRIRKKSLPTRERVSGDKAELMAVSVGLRHIYYIPQRVISLHALVHQVWPLVGSPGGSKRPLER